MLTINIKHSKSKHYAEVLKMVLDAGGRMNDGVLVLEVPDNILLYCYETLIPIVEIVSKWKGTEAFYNSKKVELFRFLYNAWGNIGQCAKGRNDTWNSRWCWQNIDNQGWGASTYNHFRPLTMAMADTSGAIGFGTILGSLKALQSGK